MEKKFTFTNNKINLLLNERRINEEINIDKFLQLKEFQILSQKNNLYLCIMYDGENEDDKFILRADF